MNARKAVLCVLVAVMVVTATSCSAPAPTATPRPQAAAPSTPCPTSAPCPDPVQCPPGIPSAIDGTGLTLVFVPKLVHPWYEPAQQGAEQAAKELGAELVWAAPAQADIAEQNQLLESLLAKGMDGLCLNTLSATAQNQVVKEIMDAGVKVVMFGNDAPTSGREMFIGTGSMVEKGIVQATKMVELIGGKGKVAILTGEIGVTSFDDQIAGNMQVYDQYPDIEVVAIEPDYDDFAKALANAETIMLKYPDLAGFVGTDQTSLPAAARAVSDAGKAGEIKLVGIDLPPETADWMRKGVIQLTYIQDPYLMGYWGVYYLVSAIHGNRIPSNVDTGSLWVDQSNVDLYAPPE